MKRERLLQELDFKTARSGGAGGQNVNKVETKVLLQWDLDNSSLFEKDEKDQIRQKLSNRINKHGLLQLESSISRSQSANKEDVIYRFMDLIENALKVAIKRVSTKIPRSKILERLDKKKQHSQKKQQRKRLDF